MCSESGSITNASPASQEPRLGVIDPLASRNGTRGWCQGLPTGCTRECWFAAASASTHPSCSPKKNHQLVAAPAEGVAQLVFAAFCRQRSGLNLEILGPKSSVTCTFPCAGMESNAQSRNNVCAMMIVFQLNFDSPPIRCRAGDRNDHSMYRIGHRWIEYRIYSLVKNARGIAFVPQVSNTTGMTWLRHTERNKYLCSIPATNIFRDCSQ